MSHIKTLAGPVDLHADPIKKSRFIGSAAPASSPEAALAHVATVRAAFADAGHHCWAYALADDRERCSDDGEPGGSAGRPILAQIRGRDLRDVCVVVTRYFGGVKLGVGGLIRAYGGTAGQTLDQGEVRVVPRTVEMSLSYGYSDTGAVQNVLSARAVEITSTRWGEVVQRGVRVAEAELTDLQEALADATSGRVTAVEG